MYRPSFCSGLIALLWCCAATVVAAFEGEARASAQYSINVLERLLAPALADDEAVELGCQRYRAGVLRQWRDWLEGRLAEPATTGEDGRETTGAFWSLNPAALWPGGVVPYVFHPDVTPLHRQAFLDAAGEIAAFAQVTFVPRAGQADFVEILNAPFAGGRADVGRIGGRQTIEIGTWHRDVLVHEIGHCLGLVHEHQRADRDSYVTILFANIVPGAEGNFVLLPGTIAQGDYDFESVMHYARDLFSTAPGMLDTIVPLPAYAQFVDVMGRENSDRALSTRDRQALAATYGPPAIAPGALVTNTRDSGSGSLRAAIYHAWDHPGTTLTFAIPTTDPGFDGSVFTIRPTDVMTRPGPHTTIDGTTQPGNPNPLGPDVILRGDLDATGFADGLRVRQSHVTVRGLGVRDFAGAGIRLSGPEATGIAIEGCYLGTTPDGLAAAPNFSGGVVLDGGAHANRIGGLVAAQRNVISGNDLAGVMLIDPGTSGNLIQGNYIGLDRTGATALPNTAAGVAVFAGASGNLIGGAVAGAGNTVSGNQLQGVFLSGFGTTGNRIEGNAIGTNAARSAAVPNGWAGVELFDGPAANTIGGTTAAAGNLISGNTLQGVFLSGLGTDHNVVAGNLIGANAAGSGPLPNGWSGVEIGSDATGTVVAGNTISGNGNFGVFLWGGATATRLETNRIGTAAAGLTAVPNQWSGVQVADSSGHFLGGAAPGAGNVISGNLHSGVQLAGGTTAHNVVAGNLIGLAADGLAALPNSWSGVDVFAGAHDNRIGGTEGGNRNHISANLSHGVFLADAGTAANRVEGNSIGLDVHGGARGNGFSGVWVSGGASDNWIGGTAPGAGNRIAHSGGGGVRLRDAPTVRNRVLGNQIFANFGPGIAIVAGAHGGATAPFLVSATLENVTRVPFQFLAPVAGTYRVEFFANAVGDDNGAGEGQFLLGAIPVTTPAAPFHGEAALPAIAPIGSALSATLTDPSGNTSAFAINAIVTAIDTDGDGLPDAYELSVGLNPHLADAHLDSDGDGFSNYAEFLAGTHPLQPGSRFGPVTVAKVGDDLHVTFPASAGRTYRVDYRDELTGPWRLLVSALSAPVTGPFTVIDRGAALLPRRFYRTAVEP